MKIKAFKGISLKILQMGLLMIMISLSLSSCDFWGSLEKKKTSPADTGPPGDASALSIVTIGGGSISLTWSDPADSDLDHMIISVNPADIPDVSVAGGTGSVTLSGLTIKKGYTYTIKAVDASDNQSSGISVMAFMPSASSPVTYITSSDATAFHTLLADDVTNGTGGYYILETDIDLSGYGYWTPVGNSTTFFTGTLDGAGHTISNLSVYTATDSHQGLFGVLDAAGTLVNIVLNEAAVSSGGDYTGALVGYNLGTVLNCSVASVTGSVQGVNYVGGLVGQNGGGGTIKNSSADIKVSENSGLYMGGLVGYNRGTISNSHASGIVGEDTASNKYAGGLVGYNDAGTIENSSSSGVVTANQFGGGFAGYNENSGTITKSYSTGNVTCGSNVCGGFVADNIAPGVVSNSFATGDVSGTGLVGGFAGVNTGRLEYCYSGGAVSGSSNTGGFVGLVAGSPTFTNVYFNSTLAGQTDAYATGDIDLTVQGNFSGWDFTNTWAMDSSINGGYPYLQ